MSVDFGSITGFSSIPAVATGALMAPSAMRGQKVSPERVGEVTENFEAMFISQMLKPMLDTVEVSSDFGGGEGEDAMRGFLVQEYGKNIASAADFGLKGPISAAIIQAQSIKDGANNAG